MTSARRMRIHTLCIVALAALLAATAAESARSATTSSTTVKPVTLRVAYFLAQNTSVGQAMTWWMNAVTRETGGKVKFDTYWGGTLVGPTDMVNALKTNQIQIGLVSPAYYPGQFPLSMISNVPFYDTNTPAESSALWQLATKSSNPLAKEWTNQGLKPLAFTTVEPSVLGTKKPINSISDLNGLAIRAVDQPSSDVLKAVGANPVTMAVGQVYQSLQTGVLGGYYGVPFDFVTPLHLNEVAPYVTDPGMGLYALDSLAMTTSTWKSLGPSTQKIMMAVAKAFPAHAAQIFGQSGDAACKALKSAGAHISVLSASVRHEWRNRIGNKVFADWKSGSPSAAAFLKSLTPVLRTQLHKYKGWTTSITRCVQGG